MKENDYLYTIAGSMGSIIIFLLLIIIAIIFVANLISKNNKIQKEHQETLKEISEKQNAIIAELQMLRGFTPYNNYQQPHYYKDNRRNF